jgi:hypothetical protein
LFRLIFDGNVIILNLRVSWQQEGKTNEIFILCSECQGDWKSGWISIQLYITCCSVPCDQIVIYLEQRAAQACCYEFDIHTIPFLFFFRLQQWTQRCLRSVTLLFLRFSDSWACTSTVQSYEMLQSVYSDLWDTTPARLVHKHQSFRGSTFLPCSDADRRICTNGTSY